MNISTFKNKLKAIFQQSNINGLARKTGFTKRLRVLNPTHLVCAIIQTLGTQHKANLADIHRCFGKLAGALTMPNYKPFHNQLKKPELVQLLETLVSEASALWLLEPFKNALPDSYPFKQIHLHDGSSLKLHNNLAGTFPGRFTKTAPAAIELHMTMDLTTGTANYLGIGPDKESERLYNPYANELKDTLVLMDAGYFNIGYCYATDENGGYFIIRAPRSINPEIVEAFDEQGNPVKALKGKQLKQLKLEKDRQLDLMVIWPKRTKPMRIIAFWDRRKSCIGYLITNLKRENFSLQTICELYGVRWQIELFFKELKSFCNLSTFNTQNKNIVLSLVWGSMLTLLLKRYTAYTTGLLHNVVISTLKVARCSTDWLSDLISALLSPTTLHNTINEVTEYLAVHGTRAHLKRDKETLLLRLGLSIYPVTE